MRTETRNAGRVSGNSQTAAAPNHEKDPGKKRVIHTEPDYPVVHQMESSSTKCRNRSDIQMTWDSFISEPFLDYPNALMLYQVGWTP